MAAPPADVVDQLERLAAHASTGTLDPDAVWARGRRRERSRWSAAIVGMVAMGALGTAAVTPVLEMAQPVASRPSATVLPDVIRGPGGWAPPFSGAPGRLSAVALGSRSGLWGSADAWWGLSATSGASRWLELPDVATDPGVQPELSSDGRLLAYWVTGEVDSEPVGPGAVEGQAPVVAVAVLDLETGVVRRWGIDSPHGLYVNGLAWAGDVLWWAAGPAKIEGDGAFSAEVRTRTWDLSSDARREVTDRAARSLLLQGAGDAPEGFITTGRRLALEQVAGDADPVTLRLRLPSAISTQAGVVEPTVSPDGRYVLALQVPDVSRYDGAPRSVVAGLVAEGRTVLDRVGGVEAHSVLGWRSPTEALVASSTDLDGDGTPDATQVSAVDVTGPGSSTLLDIEGTIPSFAADALAGEVVAAPKAPFAPDPRWFGAAAVVLGLVLMGGWRWTRGRRGHP